MNNKQLQNISKPVAYSLRFRNMHTGEPDKNINANTTFSTLEKAKAYGLGSRYVKQDDGKIVSVRDPQQDPIVEPLYSQEYVSALLAELEVKDKRIANLEFEQGGYGYSVLEDLNDKTKRIAELSRLLAYNIERAEAAEKRLPVLEQDKLWLNEIINSEANRADAAEAKLAAPVRLPNKNDDEFWFGSTFQVAKFDRAVERAISAAGFKFVGDKQ